MALAEVPSGDEVSSAKANNHVPAGKDIDIILFPVISPSLVLAGISSAVPSPLSLRKDMGHPAAAERVERRNLQYVVGGIHLHAASLEHHLSSWYALAGQK